MGHFKMPDHKGGMGYLYNGYGCWGKSYIYPGENWWDESHMHIVKKDDAGDSANTKNPFLEDNSMYDRYGCRTDYTYEAD